jgi:AraC-like DNA-binding protein
MTRERLYTPVEVIHRKIDVATTADGQLTFFQMAYVIAGEGRLRINGNRIPYDTGNLMLLTPNDSHSFEPHTPSEFLLIRFNKSYIKEFQWKSLDHMEVLLYHATHLSGCILRCKSDEWLVRSIVGSILHEMSHSGLINYIQLNISSPEKLRSTAIAKTFGLSHTYLGSYFKNQCGETILHYIANYRIRLIEHRLKFSDMRVNEIATEFGFTDESHLNKFFKKHRRLNLTGYRRSANPIP